MIYHGITLYHQLMAFRGVWVEHFSESSQFQIIVLLKVIFHAVMISELSVA